MKKGKKSICLFINAFIIATFLIGINTEILIAAEETVTKENPIKLRYGSIFPPTHPISVADQAWIEKIEKGTGGRIKIEPYWAGSLISMKETYQDVMKGICDIGYVLPGLSPAGFDLCKAEEKFYYGIKNSETMNRIYHEIRTKFPELNAEFAQVKIMASSAASPHQLHTKKPARNLDDLKGLRVRAIPTYIPVLKELGAEGVPIPAPDIFISLQKGIIDGVSLPYESLKSLKFAEITKYTLALNINMPPVVSRAMNLEKWNSLPADIQKILEENIVWWGKETEKEFEKADQLGIDFAKKSGHEFFTLSPEDSIRFNKLQEAEAFKEAEKLDNKGLPATKILKEIRRLAEN